MDRLGSLDHVGLRELASRGHKELGVFKEWKEPKGLMALTAHKGLMALTGHRVSKELMAHKVSKELMAHKVSKELMARKVSKERMVPKGPMALRVSKEQTAVGVRTVPLVFLERISPAAIFMA